MASLAANRYNASKKVAGKLACKVQFNVSS
jgi:hypothetical protein